MSILVINMIKVGQTALHGYVQEVMKFPPKGITYSQVKPAKNILLECPLQYYNSKKHDLLESNDFACFTENRWIQICYNYPALLAFTMFGNYYSRKTRTEIIKSIFLKKNLKKIIITSNKAFELFKKNSDLVSKEILRKSCVVYPAIRKIKDKDLNNQPKESVNIIFTGSDFLRKGGLQLISAFEKLQGKFDNLKLILASNFYEIDSQFDKGGMSNILMGRISKNKGINITGFLERENLLNNYYPYAHIAVLPTLKDSTPYALIEPQAFGIPLVTTDIFSNSEIVTDNKTGLLIKISKHDFFKEPNKFKFKNDKYIVSKGLDKKLTNGIYKNLKTLIEDNSLRRNMGRNALKNARTKFSIKKRNKIMKAIYEESIS